MLDHLMAKLRGNPWQSEGVEAGVIDSPPVKITEGGTHGIDTWKKVNSRGRHIPVDALGLTPTVVVTADDVPDLYGAKPVFASIRGRFNRLRLVWADGIDTVR